ncbi:MAG: helix-turn-helix domain-containing protein, partial [Deltaproteobacteria bacterium]|nr:helix-turn-helix domain-containing protein [Deltaproteobacteria bacterium]
YLKKKNLSSVSAKLLYGVMIAHCDDRGVCCATQQYLSTCSGQSVSLVKQNLTELKRNRLFRRINWQGHLAYFLPVRQIFKEATMPTTDSQKLTTNRQKLATPVTRKSALKPACITAASLEPKSPPTPPQGESVVQESKPAKPSTPYRPAQVSDQVRADFEHVVASYPNQSSVQEALRTFNHLACNQRLPKLEDLLACIEYAKSTDRWRRENGRFVPYLRKFLRYEHWREYLPAVEAQRHRIAEAEAEESARVSRQKRLQAVEQERQQAEQQAFLERDGVNEAGVRLWERIKERLTSLYKHALLGCVSGSTLLLRPADDSGELIRRAVHREGLLDKILEAANAVLGYRPAIELAA